MAYGKVIQPIFRDAIMRESGEIYFVPRAETTRMQESGATLIRFADQEESDLGLKKITWFPLLRDMIQKRRAEAAETERLAQKEPEKEKVVPLRRKSKRVKRKET